MQVQAKEANRFRAEASAAAAGARAGPNEADRAYRQMVADPSSTVHPMLRYAAVISSVKNTEHSLQHSAALRHMDILPSCVSC